MLSAAVHLIGGIGIVARVHLLEMLVTHRSFIAVTVTQVNDGHL